MATFVYPRLRNLEARGLIEELSAADAASLEAPRELLTRSLVWAPTGTRAPLKHLEELRSRLREAATTCGYVYGAAAQVEGTEAQKADLDLKVAEALYGHLQITHHEAAQAGVWRYVACLIAPELVRWRFVQGGRTSAARFGGNRVRNFFARLWWRAALLRDPHHSDPWRLIRELGEDELVQITERPSAAAFKPLATAIGHLLLEKQNGQVARSHLMRDAMKRLVRRMPLVRYEAMTAPELRQAIGRLYDESLTALDAGGRARQTSMLGLVARRPATDTPSLHWRQLSLERRHAFLRALVRDDVQKLSALASPGPCPWGETEAPFTLLHTLDVDVPGLVRAMPIPMKITVTSSLGIADLAEWLSSAPAGSWATEVLPDRGRALVEALPIDWLERFPGHPGAREAQGDDALLRSALLRRYDGGWHELVGWMDDALCLTLLDALDIEGGDGPPRDLLASWLVGKPVTAPRVGILLAAGDEDSPEARRFLAGALMPEGAPERPGGGEAPRGGSRSKAKAAGGGTSSQKPSPPAHETDVHPEMLYEALRHAAGLPGFGSPDTEQHALNDDVARLFEAPGGVASGALQAASGLSAGQVLRIVERAMDDGFLSKRGERRGRRYFVVGTAVRD